MKNSSSASNMKLIIGFTAEIEFVKGNDYDLAEVDFAYLRKTSAQR